MTLGSVDITLNDCWDKQNAVQQFQRGIKLQTTENWMPCLLRRLISVVFANAAPGVYTPPLEEEEEEEYRQMVKTQWIKATNSKLGGKPREDDDVRLQAGNYITAVSSSIHFLHWVIFDTVFFQSCLDNDIYLQTRWVYTDILWLKWVLQHFSCGWFNVYLKKLFFKLFYRLLYIQIQTHKLKQMQRKYILSIYYLFNFLTVFP